MDNVENVITMVYRNRKENEKKKVKQHYKMLYIETVSKISKII